MANKGTHQHLAEKTVTATPGAGNGETLPVVNSSGALVGVTYYDPNGASRTGVILTAGTQNGDNITIVNISTTYSFTFAASGTSNVSTGASLIVNPNKAVKLAWNITTSLWHPLTSNVTASDMSLASGTVLVGNSSGISQARTLSGDVTIDNTGVSTVSNEVYAPITIYNDTGITLIKGQLVKLSSFSSTNGKTVVLADADNSLNATHVVVADILSTASGSVVGYKVLSGFDTSLRTIGDPLYLSATAGAFTNTAPTAANAMVQLVGIVQTVNASTGTIVFCPGLRMISKSGTNELQNLSVTNALIANSTVQGAKLAIGKGYPVVTADTNATSPVNVFTVSGAPTAFTVNAVVVISKDTTAGNIILKQGSNTVCTIAKGTVAGVLVGATSLANTVYAPSDVCTVESSSSGNASVLIYVTYN